MMTRHHQEILHIEEKVSKQYVYDYSKERENVMTQILSVVGENCHKLLSLVLYENLSLKEVAKQMGYSSEDVAKMTHHRCKKKLINEIKDKIHLKDLLQVD